MNKIPIVVIVIGIILILAGIVIISNVEENAEKNFRKGVLYEDTNSQIKITGKSSTKEESWGLIVHIKSKYAGGTEGGYNEAHGNFTWNLTNGDCNFIKTFTLTRDETGEQVFIPKCSYIEDDGETENSDNWIAVGTLCTQRNAEEVKGDGCPDGTYTWDSKGEEVMVYDLDQAAAAIGQAIIEFIGSFGACCCGVVVLLGGIILAFTMDDPQPSYEANQDSNLFNQDSTGGQKSADGWDDRASGWDGRENYIRKEKTEEVEETKEKTPETDQEKGEYKIPPPE